MSYIKNGDKLLDHGEVKAREITKNILEKALEKADPYLSLKNLVRREGDLLYIGEKSVDLRETSNVYVLGSGKASYPLAVALEEVLGDFISEGLVSCKYGQEGELSYIKLHLASHPIPDENSLEAGEKMLSIAEKTRPGDLVITIFTGGCSALASAPVKEIKFSDKQEVNRLLLHSGANIVEINNVRKHLSRFKGGFLASVVHPEAVLVNFTVSDVIGDPLDYITCPTVPDTSTFDDARATLTRYSLWEKMPANVVKYLQQGGEEQETPKDFSDRKVLTHVVVPGAAACEGAFKAAENLGLISLVLSTMLEGEAREVGGTFADIAREIRETGSPVAPPCAIIGGGENTVRILDKCGKGGPNQEFAAGAALRLEGLGTLALASLDTDGTDGPTEYAGGLVDTFTNQAASAEGIDLYQALESHDISPVFEKLKEVIITGATGTNVNDLKLMVILPKE